MKKRIQARFFDLPIVDKEKLKSGKISVVVEITRKRKPLQRLNLTRLQLSKTPSKPVGIAHFRAECGQVGCSAEIIVTAPVRAISKKRLIVERLPNFHCEDHKLGGGKGRNIYAVYLSGKKWN